MEIEKDVKSDWGGRAGGVILKENKKLRQRLKDTDTEKEILKVKEIEREVKRERNWEWD